MIKYLKDYENGKIETLKEARQMENDQYLNELKNEQKYLEKNT